jgi:hypothetical protein
LEGDADRVVAHRVASWGRRACVLSVLAGPDPRVPLSVQQDGRAYTEPPPPT